MTRALAGAAEPRGGRSCSSGSRVAAYLTRAQAVALVPAPSRAAPLAFAREPRSSPLPPADVLGRRRRGALGVLEQVARGRSAFGVLGAYEVGRAHALLAGARRSVVRLPRRPSSTCRSASCPSRLVLLVAALPPASTGRRRSSSPRPRLALGFWLVLEVAVFAAEQSFRVEERNMFYVAPLFLIALLVWIDRGLPRGTGCGRRRSSSPRRCPRASRTRASSASTPISDTIALLPLGGASSTRGSRSHDTWSSFSRRPRSRALPLAAAAVRARPAGSSWSCSSVLRGLAGGDRGARTASLEALFGDRRRFTWTGSTARSGRMPRSRRSGRGAAGATRSGRTSLQPALRRSTTSARAAARRARRDAGRGQPRTGDCSPPASPSGRSTRWRTVARAGGAVIARDDRQGMVLYSVDGPLRLPAASRRLRRHVVAGATCATRSNCRAGRSRCSSGATRSSSRARTSSPRREIARLVGDGTGRPVPAPTNGAYRSRPRRRLRRPLQSSGRPAVPRPPDPTRELGVALQPLPSP